MTVDPINALEVLAATPFMPQDDDGPVFTEPWEAQAFAIVLSLYQRGLFEWQEWSSILGEEITRAQQAGDSDTGTTYYTRWVRALEILSAEKGLTDQQTLGQYHDAWARAAARTPHGKPIDLRDEDFAAS